MLLTTLADMALPFHMLAEAPARTELFSTENAIALVTLTAMEIVLGIDNIVFIAILAGRVPEAQ